MNRSPQELSYDLPNRRNNSLNCLTTIRTPDKIITVGPYKVLLQMVVLAR